MTESLPTRTLGELVELRTDKVLYDKDPLLPYVGLEHMEQGAPRLLGIADSSVSVSVNSIFEKDDILFGKLRPNLRKSLRAQFKGYCSTDILVLRCREEVIPAFAAHVFQWERVFAAASATAAGTKMPRTSWKDLRRFRVFAPESDCEQSHIATVLDAADEAIANTEAVIAKLRQVRNGVLHDLLTRGLDEDGQLRPLSAKAPHLYLDSPLGKIPREWRSRRLGDVLQKAPRNGYSPPEAPLFQGRLLLGLGCLTPDGFAPAQLKNAPLDAALDPFLLSDGDLLISRSNTLELVALPGIFKDVGWPCFYPDLMMRLVPNDELSPGFLELLLRHSPLRTRLVASANGTSGSMVKITGAGVMHTPVAFPPLGPNSDEQERILAAKYAIDEHIKNTAAELAKLQSLKTGLMTDLLTGHVRVPETLSPDEVSA